MSPKHSALASAACFALAAALSACASRFPEIDESHPEADRLFYEARCGVCHVPFHPSDYIPEQWPEILSEMAPKAGLNKAQRKRVLGYLKKESEAAFR